MITKYVSKYQSLDKMIDTDHPKSKEIRKENYNIDINIKHLMRNDVLFRKIKKNLKAISRMLCHIKENYIY